MDSLPKRNSLKNTWHMKYKFKQTEQAQNICTNRCDIQKHVTTIRHIKLLSSDNVDS